MLKLRWHNNKSTWRVSPDDALVRNSPDHVPRSFEIDWQDLIRVDDFNKCAAPFDWSPVVTSAPDFWRHTVTMAVLDADLDPPHMRSSHTTADQSLLLMKLADGMLPLYEVFLRFDRMVHQ